MAGYQLRSKFELGYRNKEDISTLPPEVLVVGSQNVLTNAAEQVGIRQGYVLDGAAGTQNNYGTDSSYDFESQSGTKNTRKWGGNWQVRYLNPATTLVSWITMLSSLAPTRKMRFTDFWDYNTEKKELCLAVNGDNNVIEWSGAVASVAATSNASGIISAIVTVPNTDKITSGGINYVVGDILTITTGDATATLQALSVALGGIGSLTVTNGGTGYNVNDILVVNHASTSFSAIPAAVVKVTSVDGSNHLTGLTLLTAGQGYFNNQILTLSAVTGGGSAGTVTVNSSGNTITSWQLLTNGTGYSAANNVPTTGGSGTGATASITSVGINSITVQGTTTLSQLGFYDNVAANSGKFMVLINGATYTYTASNGNGGQTLVGVLPDPTAAGIAVGDAVIQKPVVGAASSATFLGADFKLDLISTVGNQVYYGNETNNTVFVSKTNNYADVSFSSPRIPGDGALVTLDSPPVGFKPQSTQSGTNPSVMYIAAGNNAWYATNFTLSSDLVHEGIQIQKLKTTARQGAQSQEFISDFKNTITFVSNEPQLNEFGVSANFFAEPQMTNISDPIKYDMDAYDFAGGAVDYDNYYLYIIIPANSVVRMYNLAKKYWEAPQVLPISRFYRVDGALYGHSSMTDESYQLFTGYNDNGNPINAVAAFPYVAAVEKVGEPDDLKAFDREYTEGYIAGNTTLTLTINYDFGGFSGTYSADIEGQSAFANGLNPIIFNKVTDGSLGQNSLGSQPIGTILNLGNQPNIPKFRVINTMPKHDFFESQIVYSSNDIDQQWTLLRFGPRMQMSINTPSFITE